MTTSRGEGTGGGLPIANLLIVGTGKAGTTSLFHYLAQHPDICGSKVKETHYFTPLRRGEQPGPVAEYAFYFDHCKGERYRLEATPAYIDGGSATIATLKDVLGAPRLIINLRDPAERLWDNFLYMRSKMLPAGLSTFEEYLDRCLQLRAEGLDGSEEHGLYQWTRSFYSEYISEWLEAFGDDLRIVFFDDLAEDPARVLRELCAWLEVDPAPVVRFDYKIHNSVTAHRYKTLQRWAFKANQGLRDSLKSRFAMKRALTAIYHRVNTTGTRQPAMDPSIRRRLDEVFEPSNRALVEILTNAGYRDLPAWLCTTHEGTS